MTDDLTTEERAALVAALDNPDGTVQASVARRLPEWSVCYEDLKPRHILTPTGRIVARMCKREGERRVRFKALKETLLATEQLVDFYHRALVVNRWGELAHEEGSAGE